MDVVLEPVHTLDLPNWRRNQIYRNIGRLVQATGGQYCHRHGLCVPDCGQCRGSCPDLSPFVFGGLHKKREWELI